MMFRDLYLSELETLHRLSGELAERFPELTPMLGRDADPGTSRLLQRLAFALARARERVTDDVPEVIHAIFEDLDPHMLQPLPSMAMLELVPHSRTQRSITTVDAGTTFGTARLGGTRTFVATEACDVRPWALRSVAVCGTERREIRLGIEVLPSSTLAQSIGGDAIALSLTTERIEQALDLRALLVRHTRRVRARSGAAEVELSGGVRGAAAMSLGIGRSSTRLPLSTVRDYFACPRVFCQVEIPGAKKLVLLGEEALAFELILELDEPVPQRVPVDESALRLHNIPAISLASVEARLERSAGGHYVVRTNDADDRVLDVERVDIVDAGGSRRVARWTPSAATRVLDEAGGPVLFEVHRRPSVLENEIDFSISFLDEEGPTSLAPEAFPQARVLVTSAERASELAVGDISQPTETSPVGMTFRNVTTVTRGGAPLFANDRLWEIFQLTKLGIQALADRGALGRLLALLNVPAWLGWPRAKAGLDMFEALLAVEQRRVMVIAEGEGLPGIEIDLALDAGAFLCEGDVYLFGEVVSRLLASALDAHEHVTLTLRRADLAPIEYPRLFGQRE
jgi:type VI secretion system protein ImpG